MRLAWWQTRAMSRRPPADEVDGLYHALEFGPTRGVTIFRKESDHESFEPILAEGLDRDAVRSLAAR